MILDEKGRALALDRLQMLHGIAPHDTSSNICRGDGYFAQSIVREFGMPLDALAAAIGFDDGKPAPVREDVPDRVRPDHFVGQFDKAADPFGAACRHAAMLLNSMNRKEHDHIRDLRRVVERLRNGDNVVAIALDLTEKLQELEQ